ncbi:MAG: hypothetical protein K1X74_13745 [Pirellulales bacterium]|nr:hypothetical protein [Pirellulales bacterium]
MLGLSGVQVRAIQNLNDAVGEMSAVTLRLASLRRINSAADDPAGLIAVTQIEDELSALEAADHGTDSAGAVVDVADSALAQVGELLRRIDGHVVSAAGDTISEDERAALQIEVDAAIDAIDRIGRTTEFNGVNLLDGSLGDGLTYVLAARADQTARLDLPVVSRTSLGSTAARLAELATGGSLNLASGNIAQAASVVESARRQVASARAGLGAFARFTLDSSREVNAAKQVGLTAALAQLDEVNVAAESSRLVRARLLASTSMAALRTVVDRRSAPIELADLLGP